MEKKAFDSEMIVCSTHSTTTTLFFDLRLLASPKYSLAGIAKDIESVSEVVSYTSLRARFTHIIPLFLRFLHQNEKSLIYSPEQKTTGTICISGCQNYGARAYECVRLTAGLFLYGTLLVLYIASIPLHENDFRRSLNEFDRQ